MDNQYINKFVKDGVTKFDLTSDTVTPETLVKGVTAHDASGKKVSGTFIPVTGVKGNAETAYRTGNVNLTAANIGAVNKNGDTMSGTLTDTARFIAKSTNIDRDGDNPSTLTSGNEFRLTDKSNLSVGGMYPQQETSGAIRNILYSRSGSSYNTFAVIIDKDGTPRYSVSSPTAFRTAIGLNNVNNTSDLNKPISTATQAALDSQQEKIDNVLEQTGYNLLKLTNQTITTNNVTFNVDGATGTITATRTGTQTANAYLNLDVPDTVYGKMCLSGCADGGNADTYSVYPWDATTGARPKNWEGTANAGTSISASDYVEVDYVQGHTNRITIRITPTTSFTTLTFKPMIVPEALAGIQFQPYAKSNVELTQDLDNAYIKHLNITCSTASGENPTVTAVDKTFNQIADAIQNGGLVFASLHWTRGTQGIFMSIIIDTFITNTTGIHVITGTSSGGGTGNMYRLTWQSNNSLPTISNVS